MTHYVKAWIGVLALVLLPVAAGAVRPDTQTIIAKSVAANNANWEAAPSFDFTELDKTNTGTKTHRVTMILGSPYYRLVAVNGKPLLPSAEEEEQRRLKEAVAKRRAETPEQRSERVAQYEKERRRDHILMSQLTEAFNFTLKGGRRMGRYDVYVLGATSKAGYKPPNMQSQALTGMEGTLWIDRATFQWVKVEAHVVRAVSIDGFLARVEPGTYFELELAPVEGNIWLPTHFAMKSRAKVLHVINHKTQDDETYSHYRRTVPANGAGKPLPHGRGSDQSRARQ